MQIIVFLCLLSVGAAKASQVDTYLQLQTTHTFFQGIIAADFEGHDTAYDPEQLANKAYIQTFLKVWSDAIESGHFKTTEEIFGSIAQSEGYLAKYYYKWAGIHHFPSARGSLNLNGTRSQFLDTVLISEKRFPDLNQRLKFILQMAAVYILTTDQDYNLTLVIAAPFLKNQNSEVRQAASELVSGISFQKSATVVSFVFDLLAATVAGPVALKGKSLFQLPNLSKISRVAVPAKLIRGFKSISPFLKNRSRLQWSAFASLGLHAGGLGSSLLYLADEKQNGVTKTETYEPTIFTLNNLWNSFDSSFPDNFGLENYKDFRPNFKLADLKEIVASVRDHIQKKTQIDYGLIFFQTEKYKGIDHRDKNDFLAMDFIQGGYERLKFQVSRIVGNELLDQTKLDQIRKLAISSVLHNYKRDYPNLTSTFMGWGGNCVAESMLLIALLEPYVNRLPTGSQLSVLLTSDHMEAAVWDGKYLTRLMQGTRNQDTDGLVLYRYEWLMAVLLRNYLFKDQLFDAKYKDSSYYKIDLGKTLLASAQLSVSHLFKRFNLKKDKREGVLEDLSIMDLQFGMENGNAAGNPDDVPYSAQISFSQIVDSVGDLFRSHMSSSQSEGDQNRNKLKFRYVINLVQKKDHELSRFQSENYSDMIQVDAFDESIYLEFINKSHEAGLTPIMFLRFVDQKQDEDLQRIVSNETFKKVYFAPQQDDFESTLSAFLACSDDELRMAQKLTNEFNSSLAVKLGRNNDKYQLIEWNRLEPIQIGIQLPYSFSEIIEREAKITANIARNPKRYLEFYNNASPLLRKHLLVRFFGLGYLESYVDQNPNIRFAQASIRNYLNKLSQIKVDFSHEANVICSKIKIDLPKVSGWPWQYSFADEHCRNDFPSSKDIVLSDSNAENKDSKDALELKVSTLIELTVEFRRGLQLWTDSVASAFQHGNYSEIILERGPSIQIIETMVNTDSNYMNDSKFTSMQPLFNSVRKKENGGQ